MKAQEAKPDKNDRCSTVKNDILQFGLNLSFEEIGKISKNKLSQKVRSACTQTAFKYLLNLQEGHSKGSDIVYGSLKLQSYLHTEDINVNST